MNELQKIGLLISPKTEMQKRYQFDNEHRFYIVSAGRRSRKTIIGMWKVWMSAIENPKTKYFLGAPTREQAKQIFWERTVKAFKLMQMTANRNDTSLKLTLKNGSIIRVVGLDKPERIEGETPSWNGCLITEFPNLKSHAWSEHIRPVLSDTKGFAILDGVPDFRHPHYHDLAMYATGGFIPKTEPIKGAFAENPKDKEWCFYSWYSSDVLSEKEIESAKRELDEKIYRQEYEGSFERAGGLVWYNYELESQTDKVFDNTRPTYLSWDFNVNPMTCLVIQTDGAGNDYVVKEFVNHNSNTTDTADQVIQWLNDKGLMNDLGLTGDASGISRKTAAQSGAISDWVILQDKFRNFKGYHRRLVKSNPNIRDRVNATNARFKNTLGERKLFINIEKCPYLHKDLTRQVYKDDGTLEDKDNIGHRTDALSYYIYNYKRISNANQYRG